MYLVYRLNQSIYPSLLSSISRIRVMIIMIIITNK